MAKKITEQGIFNFVYRFIVKQGEPATSGTHCQYRAERDGKVLCCAVGCLLTDEEATKVSQTVGWSVQRRGDKPKRFLPFYDLFLAMQDAHDRSDPKDFVGSFTRAMTRIAYRRGLTVPSDV